MLLNEIIEKNIIPLTNNVKTIIICRLVAIRMMETKKKNKLIKISEFVQFSMRMFITQRK